MDDRLHEVIQAIDGNNYDEALTIIDDFLDEDPTTVNRFDLVKIRLPQLLSSPGD
jgi:hypothetical protein